MAAKHHDMRPDRYYSKDRILQHFPALPQEKLDEIMQTPGWSREIHEMSQVFDEDWKTSTVELAMAESKKVDKDTVSATSLIPLWKMVIRVWNIPPMYIIGSHTCLWFQPKMFNKRRTQDLPEEDSDVASHASSQGPPKEPSCYTWTRFVCQSFRELFPHPYWQNQPWLLPAALEWASMCKRQDKRPWTAPTDRTDFFRLLHSISRQYPESIPEERLRRVEQKMAESGRVLCEHYTLFCHILKNSQKTSVSKPPEYAWEPKRVEVPDCRAVILAVQAITTINGEEPVSGKDYLEAFEKNREGGKTCNHDFPWDTAKLLELTKRSVAHDILALERMKMLYELGWPLEKIRFLLLHPKLRTGTCFPAGSDSDSDSDDDEIGQDEISDLVPDQIGEDEPMDDRDSDWETVADDEPMDDSAWETVSEDDRTAEHGSMGDYD